MRNFFFDNSEEPEYRDSYHGQDEEDDGAEGFMIPAQVEFMHMAQLDLASVDLNQKLLSESIRLLEKSWSWRFQPLEVKLTMVRKTYSELTNLMEEVAKEGSKEEKK